MNRKKILQLILAATTFAGGISLPHDSVEATEVKDKGTNNIDNTQVINMARSIMKGQVINAPTSLRVRADAGTNFSVLGYLGNGTNVNIKAQKGEWYRIDFNGRDGYVHKDYVKIIESNNNSSSSITAQKGQVINASVGLNVRQSASTSSAVLGSLKNGETFEIIAKSGVWYNIKAGSLVGFIHGDYVKVLDDSTTPPSTPSTPDTNITISKGKVVNVPTNLRVRTEPNTSSSILGYLLQGNEVEITGESGSWYKINFNNKVGYVHKDYVQKIETVTPPTTNPTPPVVNPSVNKKGQVINASVGLNIRKSASTSSTILGSLSNGATFDILGLSGQWYNIKSGNIIGYVHKDYVKEISNDTSTTNPSTPDIWKDKAGQVIEMSSNLRVRSEANDTSTVLGYLVSGDKITITGESGKWYKINFNGKVGYVHSDYIRIIDESSSGNTETSAKFETILNAMKQHLGSPYVWGGAGELLTTSLLKEFKSWYPNETAAGMYSRADKYVDKGYRAFDCSGLMQWGFRQAGIYLGRSTWDQIGNGVEVHLNDIKPGDLLFYSNLQHVGMYIGNGQWIEAPNKNADVRITNVPWNLVGRARRVLQ